MKLLIVESPGKIKKLQSILGADWTVKASYGHIRDLPDRDYGLQAPDYKMNYVVTKKDVVKRLKDSINKDTEVYLASDPDREGESIAWHLLDVLGLKAYKRVTYTAITKQDVEAGIAAAREINFPLVDAQEARRAIDRLVGWEVSPSLCAALNESHMSAGRVQSVAVRLVVERENEIKNFVSKTHYGVEMVFDRLENVTPGWRALWLPKEGWLDEGLEYFLDKSIAEKIAALRSLAIESCVEKEARTAPPAPFTTSTLQQAASNALKFKPKKTMELAQKLYEAGHITYMRTDSPNLSESALKELLAYCSDKGWPLADKPRTWKASGDAQEAHECIRPTHFDVEEAPIDTAGMRDGERFQRDAQALYNLIRIRVLACQLADAVYDVRIARLSGEVEGKKAVFEAKGRKLKFDGWKSVMKDDAANADDDQSEPDNPVPSLIAGNTATVYHGEVKEKKTKPAPRYSEASLIRLLESKGIGRPATYASIMGSISERDYVVDDGKGRLKPTPRGEKLVEALVNKFDFMNVQFTVLMEKELDKIAQGKLSYAECVGNFATKRVRRSKTSEWKILFPVLPVGIKRRSGITSRPGSTTTGSASIAASGLRI